MNFELFMIRAMYFKGKCSQWPNLNMGSCTVDFILTLVHKRNIQLHFHLGDTILFHFWYNEEMCFNKYRIYIYKIQKIKQVTDLISCMLMKTVTDFFMCSVAYKPYLPEVL